MNDNQVRYLTIGEVSEATCLASHTLRYYESAGLMTPVSRDERGHRRYSTTTVEWVDMLRRLRDLGMTINEIRTFTGLLRTGETAAPDRLAVLQAHRDRIHDELLKLRETLHILDIKLDAYTDAGANTSVHQ